MAFFGDKITTEVHKVSTANIKKTPQGYDLFNLELSNSFWATKLIPVRSSDRSYDSLYKKYLEHDKSLNFLLGKYIQIMLTDTKYGKNFVKISSYDIVSDFKAMLDDTSKKSFQTPLRIYQFLLDKGYAKNSDASITLKPPYSEYNVIWLDGYTVCYPNKPSPGTLTLENIGLIYDAFFKDKDSGCSNPDRIETYGRSEVSIHLGVERLHKSESKRLSYHVNEIMRVGDKLTSEHEEFLLNLKL
ncbi:MAG: hypothetical protein AB1807_15105 [Pseudomonadota bacterium]